MRPTHLPDPSPYFAKLGSDPQSSPLSCAFDEGRQAHPPSGQVPIAKEAWQSTWDKILNTPRSRPGMAYVHIPFCENHCLFCGFYQNAWRSEAGPGYVDLVLSQLAQLDGKPVLDGPPLRALYLGGGTPTALGAADIHRLITGLRTALPLAPDCEITLEGRVHSFSEDKQDAAFDAGVNRVSLGVQTFDTAIRRALGRKAPRDTLITTLERLVALDAGAIVVDMMYGLPKQSFANWRADLETVDALGLDGVDHYGLNLIPGTPLMSAVEKGKLSPLKRQVLGEFYASGYEQMLSLGWHPISTSHWQAPDLRERSVYNFGAKTGWDFFAFGAGAGGSLNGYGYYNIPMLDAYGAAVTAGNAPLMGLSQASPLAPLLNTLRAGIERARIDPKALSQSGIACGLDLDPVDLLAPLWAQWQEAGLMDPRFRFWDLTLAGRFWQVQMTQRMTRYLTEAYLPPDHDTNDSWSARAEDPPTLPKSTSSKNTPSSERTNEHA